MRLLLGYIGLSFLSVEHEIIDAPTRQLNNMNKINRDLDQFAKITTVISPRLINGWREINTVYMRIYH